MADRSASGGYKLPTSSSAYHEKCIAASVKAIKEATARTTGKSHTQGDYRGCNVVAQERIWTEQVQKQSKAARKWKDNWGFMTEVDMKGAPIEKKLLPEKESFYTTSIPATTNRIIGGRINSPLNRQVFQVELSMAKRKMKTDMVNYYSNSC